MGNKIDMQEMGKCDNVVLKVCELWTIPFTSLLGTAESPFGQILMGGHLLQYLLLEFVVYPHDLTLWGRK